jgi:hypothetical protein
MAACGCTSFDRNGDQILMPEEYLAARYPAAAAPAQSPSSSAGQVRRTKAEFERFDTDASGYLSRAEARACGCEALDANGDQIIMPAEFIAAVATTNSAPAAQASPPVPEPAARPSTVGPAAAAPSDPPRGAASSWRAGQRVQAGCYGNMKTGIVDRVEGDRAWVKFADEPNCDGFRDLSALRPAPAPAAAVAPPRAGQAGAGEAPPSGTYVCQKISGSALIGLGNLEIRGDTYSGFGGGSFAPFTVSDGNIAWTRGIRGLPDGWTVTSSQFAGPDYLGRPLIKIGYRTSRGSTDLIDCVRE